MEAEEDDNDDKTWDDIITLEENKTEKDKHNHFIQKIHSTPDRRAASSIIQRRTKTNSRIWKMLMVVSA